MMVMDGRDSSFGETVISAEDVFSVVSVIEEVVVEEVMASR